MQKTRDIWNKVAETYTDDVFYLTKYECVLEKVMAHIRLGTILDFGCGPTGLMLNRLAAHPENAVWGMDISPTMVIETMKHFGGDLCVDDMRGTLFKDNFFDSVVSINSILPGTQVDMLKIFQEAYRILKPGGRLVAYLPSYDYVKRLAKAGFPIELDTAQCRVYDTMMWQCFYMDKIIEEVTLKAKFFKFMLSTEVFDEPEMLADMKKIYNHDFSEYPPVEYFLVAIKQR